MLSVCLEPDYFGFTPMPCPTPLEVFQSQSINLASGPTNRVEAVCELNMELRLQLYGVGVGSSWLETWVCGNTQLDKGNFKGTPRLLLLCVASAFQDHLLYPVASTRRLVREERPFHADPSLWRSRDIYNIYMAVPQ